MLPFIKAIVLGVVEGITEFLPVSSTGHLIIVNRWVSFADGFTEMFDVVIQFGAILAVVVYFWSRIWPFGKGIQKNKETWDVWRKAVVAVLPALILGKLFGDVIEERLFSPLVVSVMLVLGGIFLIIVERKERGGAITSIKEMSYRMAFGIGLIQCIAMIPGTSRSAATIIGAMMLGATRILAAEFSFFLAIPTMVAASGYALLKHGALLKGTDLAILGTGFAVSFFVALAVISFFMKYIQTHDFKMFGCYRIALGALVLLFIFG